MNNKKNSILELLVDKLVRQSNMEQWCQVLLETIQEEFHLQKMTLLIEQQNETRIIASGTGTDFRFYCPTLSLDEYKGVPLLSLRQARDGGRFICTPINHSYQSMPSEHPEQWYQLVLPIRMHDRAVGYICAETFELGELEARKQEVEDLLMVLASDVSARILMQEVLQQHQSRRDVEAELALRNESLNHYLELLKNLHTVTLCLAKAETNDDFYQTAVKLGREKLGIDRMAVFLIDFDKNEMRGTFGTDPEGNLVCRRSFCSAIPDHPLVNEALSRKDYVVVKEDAPLYYGTEQVGTGWNAMIAMWNGDCCIGWIAADNLINRRPITEHQKEIFKLFGASLGQQIVIRRQYEELKQLNQQLEERVMRRTEELLASNKALERANHKFERWSMQDGLTGVANRRFFDLSYKRLWRAAEADNSMLGLVMLDVDHFKAFNDSYGHLYGDTCLKKIAALFKSQIQPYKNAVLSRYGGEEFVCVVPGMSMEQLVAFAQSMVDGVAALAIEHKASDAGIVTISAGCCVIRPSKAAVNSSHRHEPGEYEKWSAEMAQSEHSCVLIKGADAALYRAKAQGRAQVTCCDLTLNRF
ncbi:sensor domain-containing diguanylate cyclase [Photobacterium aquae]|uniref:sensor domain-containing diguanylate cyclase n=1 Tax=Photobacterium aquae TaxID=1195763 RepID=UPI00069CE42B|nr:sensor domain-containing diguanylate cyclase [Photobacterium aquae]